MPQLTAQEFLSDNRAQPTTGGQTTAEQFLSAPDLPDLSDDPRSMVSDQPQAALSTYVRPDIANPGEDLWESRPKLISTITGEDVVPQFMEWFNEQGSKLLPGNVPGLGERYETDDELTGPRRFESDAAERAFRVAGNFLRGGVEFGPSLAVSVVDDPLGTVYDIAKFYPELGYTLYKAFGLGSKREQEEALQEIQQDPFALGLGIFGLFGIAKARGGKAARRAGKKVAEVGRKAGEAAKEAPIVTEITSEGVAKLSEAAKQMEARGETVKAEIINKPTAPEVPINQQYAGTADVPGGPQVKLYKPPVSRREAAILERIPEEKQWREATGPISIETPIRLHEKYGTKETMYHPMREAANKGDVQAKGLRDQFNQVVKDNLPFGSRGKSSRRIKIYATAQQPGGMQILRDMGITKVPELTMGEMAVYTHMRQTLGGLLKQLNQARVKSGLAPIPEVPHYFPLFRAINGMLENGRDVLTSQRLENLYPRDVRAKESVFGFKKRGYLDEYGKLSLDALTEFERYVDAAAQHVHKTPVVAKVREMLDGKMAHDGKTPIWPHEKVMRPDPRTGQMVEFMEKKNPIAYSKLNEWLDFSAGIRKPGVSPLLARAATKLQHNTMFAILSYNLRSAAIQPLALMNTAIEIGPRWVGEGINGLLTKKNRSFVLQNSETLTGRVYDVAMRDFMDSMAGRLGRAQRKVAEAGTDPLRILDLNTAMATWYGAYQKGVKQLGFKHGEAVKFADDIVVRTQASSSPHDVSPIQRTPMGKVVTSLQTFVINDWNFITKDVMGIGNPKITNAQAMKKTLAYLTATQMASLLMEEGAGVHSPYPNFIGAYAESMERDDNAVRTAYNVGKEALGQLPVVGGGFQYGGSPLGPVPQTLEEAFQALAGRKSNIRAADIAGRLAGVPGTRQATKILKLMDTDATRSRRGRVGGRRGGTR